MRYKKFVISNYRGITNPIEINLDKNSLIPIIGINECGKTTILNAIYAFDNLNDEHNATFKHLNDISNLYQDISEPCRLSAVIELNKDNLKQRLKQSFQLTEANAEEKLKDLPEKKNFDITITRILTHNSEGINSNYEISPKIKFKSENYENDFCQNLIKHLPYILYFDDFRETFPDEIEIDEDKSDRWLEIMQELFLQTNDQYSVFELKNLEARRRKSQLAQVKKKLNETLTSQWSNFRLENKESLEIDIDFRSEKHRVTVEVDEAQPDGSIIKKKVDQEAERYFLKFDIIERDAKGNEHYFYVRDRSKGFYWFFNFVMKLEFNPDTAGDHDNAIYLLDEPGSYLHPYAQSKLCKKLKDLAESNVVIYCTHSHYLLNPEVVPLNRIQVVNKKSSGDIQLESFYDYKGVKDKSLKTAFQTIYDALYIKPFDIDVNHKKILIVEGIYDYYAFSLFKNNDEIGILPGKGADSLISFISLMIAYEVDFRVLWDNDPEGRFGFDKAKKFFGDEMSSRYFYLLPSSTGKKKILQDLFESIDLNLIIQELGLSTNLSFEKKVSQLYYSKHKNRIIQKISRQTKDNFTNVLKLVKFQN
jgi:energy-coupling factor transporter ATP-binding protein EcfA2